MDALKEFFIKVSFDTSGFDALKQNLNAIKENFKANFASSANSAKDSINQINDAEKSAMQERDAWIKQETLDKINALKAELDSFSQNAKERLDILKDSEKEREQINEQGIENAKDSEKQITENLKQNIDERKNKLNNFLDTAKKLFATYLSFATIKGSISNFVDRGMLADEASSLLGITPERFDNIAKAFNRFGTESSALEQQLSSLNQDIAEATKGEGKLIGLQEKFGISIHNASGEVMSADEMLLSMSEQLKNFDAQTRAGILRILGFDTAVQSAFSDGGEALMSFYKKQQDLAMITEKDTAMAKKWTFQLKDLKDQIDRIRNAIARFLLPIFTKIAELVTKFIEWIFKHKQAFIAILATIGIMLAPILGSLIKILATQIAILAPWVALAALIGGVVLIFEDIYYYFKGYKSMTGEFVKKWAFLDNILQLIKPLVVGIGETLEKIVNFFNEPSLENFLDIFVRLGDTVFEVCENIVDMFFALFEEISEEWSNIDWLETFKELFAIEWWSEQLKIVKDAFFKAFEAVGDFFTGIFDGIIKWVSDKIKTIMSPLEGVGNMAKGAFDSVKGFFGFGDSGTPKGAPMAVPNNYATTTNNNNTQQIHINAYGVDNKTAGGLAKDIGSQIQGQQEQYGNVGRFK